jgi:hypothetical protein
MQYVEKQVTHLDHLGSGKIFCPDLPIDITPDGMDGSELL